MLDPTELFPEVPNLYEFPSVHADMLFDDERVGKYAEAISRSVKKGDVVADIGTGTGLLAFLCLQAGAKRVHAIERSGAIEWAKTLAEKNGFSDRMVFHHNDSRTLELSEKVDVVVSELIGHIAFEEGMAESLFDARERFLLPGGTTIPRDVKLRVALVHERDVYRECIECWQPIQGIDYTLMRDKAVKARYLTRVSDRDLMSEPVTFFATDFQGDEALSLDGVHTFRVLRSGEVNGIALWFDAHLAEGVFLSSSPWTRTHWRQCFVPTPRPINVTPTDHISVKVRMNLRTNQSDTFSLSTRIQKDA